MDPTFYVCCFHQTNICDMFSSGSQRICPEVFHKWPGVIFDLENFCFSQMSYFVTYTPPDDCFGQIWKYSQSNILCQSQLLRLLWVHRRGVQIKRDTFLSWKYIKSGDFQGSIQFGPMLWVWEPHKNEQKCGYPDFEGSWSHMVVTYGSGSK